MKNRETRKKLAKETLAIIKEKGYDDAQGQYHQLESTLRDMLDGTINYRPEQLEKLVLGSFNPAFETKIELSQEDSVSAILRLAQNDEKILCLNFASARNPGGGFLNGSVAQEESLALSSALYASQMAVFDYYEYHRKLPSGFYTDAMIYSPRVPVFRDFTGALIPYVRCTMVTSPAVNAGVVKRQFPDQVSNIPTVMRGRLEKLLALAASRGYRKLILGAWGCGVFQNEPLEIADLFKEQLCGRFQGVFEQVTFAIYAKHPKFYNAFEEAFGPMAHRVDKIV